MQREKIAIVALVIIIVGALSVYLINLYYPEVFENIFEGEKPIYTIETGDLVDVHYIGRFASNNTIFDTSYADPENKTGGSPAQIFVTLNTSAIPPGDYSTYSNIVGEDFVEGFIEGLVGLKTNQVATIGPVPPEKAYGVKLQVGDIIDLSSFGQGEEIIVKVIDIQENQSLPPELEEFKDIYGFSNITTLYVLREETHYIGEHIDLYMEDLYNTPLWDNATVVTKTNETLLWTYTTPDENKTENLTWVDSDKDIGYTIIYPENTTKITSINETAFNLLYAPVINDTIHYYDNDNPYGLEYIVDNFSTNKIITYLNDSSSPQNRTYREFNRTKTILRNKTQPITSSFPLEYMELFLQFLRQSDSSIKYSLGPLADETVYFELEIVEVYRPN